MVPGEESPEVVVSLEEVLEFAFGNAMALGVEDKALAGAGDFGGVDLAAKQGDGIDLPGEVRIQGVVGLRFEIGPDRPERKSAQIAFEVEEGNRSPTAPLGGGHGHELVAPGEVDLAVVTVQAMAFGHGRDGLDDVVKAIVRNKFQIHAGDGVIPEGSVAEEFAEAFRGAAGFGLLLGMKQHQLRGAHP
jgi:hypothetical protein